MSPSKKSAASVTPAKPRTKRVGHVVKTTKNEPAKFQEAGQVEEPPAPFNPAPVVETLNMWWQNGKNYWLPAPDGKWLDCTESHAGKELRAAGVPAQRPENGGLSQVEAALQYVRRHHHLDLVMNLAGKPAGVHDLEDKKRVLALSSPRLIEPLKGGWSLMEEMLHGLLGAEQTPLFIAWLKTSQDSLRAGVSRPGLVLILVGPGNSGKSLLQHHIITPLLGGRHADPSGFMFEKTDFNSELFGCEHLLMEDPATSTKAEARHYFGERMKAIAANETHRCHPKGREAVTLAPFWRLTVSLNDDPDKLRILPNLNAPDLRDKVLLLRVMKSAMPMPTATNQEREAFRAALRASLPAFAHYLKDLKLGPALVDDRFGCRAWINKEIAAQLYDDSPAGRLLEIVNLVIFRGENMHRGPWEGGADELETVLTHHTSPMEREARRFCDHNNLARLLARLKEDMPDRVSYHRKASKRLWRILPPLTDTLS